MVARSFAGWPHVQVMSVLQNQRRQLLTEQERVPPSTPLSQTSSTLLRSTPTSVSPVTSDLLLQTNEVRCHVLLPRCV